MTARHIIPGLDDPTCGIAVAAKQLVKRGVGGDDEVWVHSMWTPMVIKASIKALLTGKKLVRMPHGCTDPAKLRHHWHKKRWIAPIERWLFRRAEKIVATCEDEVKWIKVFEPRVKRIEIVSLCSSAEVFSHKERKERKDGELRLLYVGRLHPLKGVEFLLEAMRQIKLDKGTFHSLQLKIIGKDEGEGPRLRKMAADATLDVEFCGIASEESKELAYGWCDVLVLPTLSENFGLVVAEALERGKRVITTDGAPAWGEALDEQSSSSRTCGVGRIRVGYGGRLMYLEGYREGTCEDRVILLRSAIEAMSEERTE